MPRPRMPRVDGPHRALTRIRGGLRSTRYLVEDAAYDAGKALQSVGDRARAFWLSLSVTTRRGLAAALGVLAVVAPLWLVAVPALPCQLPAGDTCPPSDDAVGLVPGDALVYVHVNLDRSSDQYRQASSLAARLPTLAKVATFEGLSRVPGPRGRSADFERDLAPWFGDEAALAIIPGRGAAAQEAQLLEASDEDAAEAFAKSIASGHVDTATYRGVDVRVDSHGLATAVVRGFLVIGTESAVRAVIGAEKGAGGARSLAESGDAEAARDALPDDRFADVYLSPDGIDELISHPGGLLSQFSPFVDPGASRGAAAALVAGDDGIELAVRSVLDQKRARSNPGFFSAFEPFHPSLDADLPTESLAYIGAGDPGRAVRSLLAQATTEQPGLADAFANLVRRVDRVGGVDLEKELAPSLGREVAFALEPSPPGRVDASPKPEKLPHIAPPPTPGGAPSQGASALTQPGAPFLLFVGGGVDEESARAALARLQAPIARAVERSSQLQAPSFSQRKVGDVEAQSLRLSPTVELTYALFDGLVVIATDPAGVAQMAGGQGGLAKSDGFRAATDGFPSDPSVLAYLNLTELIKLAESAGLAADPAYATFAEDVGTFEALGLSVQSEPDLLATDARLVLGSGS